jgi:hypothetical protein
MLGFTNVDVRPIGPSMFKSPLTIYDRVYCVPCDI